jgi:hypothetical protein
VALHGPGITYDDNNRPGYHDHDHPDDHDCTDDNDRTDEHNDVCRRHDDDIEPIRHDYRPEQSHDHGPGYFHEHQWPQRRRGSVRHRGPHHPLSHARYDHFDHRFRNAQQPR